jgi:hypothetical protein
VSFAFEVEPEDLGLLLVVLGDQYTSAHGVEVRRPDTVASRS